MQERLPLFPLNNVVYPGEPLNLHIFEPRYIELINDVLASDGIFGMPVFMGVKLDYGTTLMITNVEKIYGDGRMDIKTVGMKVFRVKKLENPAEGKLYSAGDIEYVDDVENGTYENVAALKRYIKDVLVRLDLKKDVQIRSEVKSFNVAHLAGLSQAKKYELLTIDNEKDRQEYLIHHFEKLLPILEGLHETKARVMMNGHFKNFDPLNF
jgi:Lon protease-like protein